LQKGEKTMKKQCLIVLAIVATMLIGLGSLALAQSGVVAQVPGNTVVQDSQGDLLLWNCNPNFPNHPCSLPPGAPHDLPGYFDIKTAKITQIGRGLVDLFIALYEPIPAEPPYPFVAYIWQFEGGCAVPNLGVNKAGVQVVWNTWPDGITEWRANWFVITQCTPVREIDIDEVTMVPFKFTEDGIKVQVALSDLLTAKDPGEPLFWFAAIRRIPFIRPPFTHTVPVDFAPDVEAFTPDGTLIGLEDPATWVPR
jgi:hypothetical protein